MHWCTRTSRYSWLHCFDIIISAYYYETATPIIFPSKPGCNSSIWGTGAVRFFRSVQLGPSIQWGSLFDSGRGFAFYLARYGNADREEKMCSWIKGFSLRAASVTLGNLDYGVRTRQGSQSCSIPQLYFPLFLKCTC